MIHTGDWHIKVPENKKEREWWLNRFNKFLQLLPKDDILVIGGDVFDTIPTYYEILIFLDALKYLKDKYEQILIIEGNHDYKGLKRYLIECLDIFSDFINIRYTHTINAFDYKGKMVVYCNHFFNDRLFDYTSDILIAHIRGNIKYAKEEIDIEKLKERHKLILLADLHNVFRYSYFVFYSTSPYQIQFKTINDLEQTNEDTIYGYNKVDIENLKIEHIALNLPRKYKLKTNEYKEKQFVYNGHFIKVVPHLEEIEVENTEEIIDEMPIVNDMLKVVENYIQRRFPTIEVNKVIDILDKIIGD